MTAPLRVLWSIWFAIWALFSTALFSFISWLVIKLGQPQDKAQWAPRTWARTLAWGTGCSLKVTGRNNIQPGVAYVFASNHISALDIPFLQSVLPSNFRWLAKKELFKIFLFGPAMASMGYIPLDRSDRRAAMQSVQDAAARISGGASVVIFPEGTRSQDGSLGEFKSAGLSLAIKAEAPVIPVAIKGLHQVMPPHRLMIRPGPVEMIFAEPIPTLGMKMKDRGDLAQQVRQKVAEMLGGEAR